MARFGEEGELLPGWGASWRLAAPSHRSGLLLGGARTRPRQGFRRLVSCYGFLISRGLYINKIKSKAKW